jgi:hypothetical protein
MRYTVTAVVGEGLHGSGRGRSVEVQWALLAGSIARRERNAVTPRLSTTYSLFIAL